MKLNTSYRNSKVCNRLLISLLALFLFSGRTSLTLHAQSHFLIENIANKRQDPSKRAITFNQAVQVASFNLPTTNYKQLDAVYTAKNKVAYKLMIRKYIFKNHPIFNLQHSQPEQEEPFLKRLS